MATHKPDAAQRQRLTAERAGAVLNAGGMLRLPEVLALVPVSPSTWYAGIQAGRFPRGIRISARCTAWQAASIRELLDRLAADAEVTP